MRVYVCVCVCVRVQMCVYILVYTCVHVRVCLPAVIHGILPVNYQLSVRKGFSLMPPPITLSALNLAYILKINTYISCAKTTYRVHELLVL